MIQAILSTPGVIGARQPGAGFGGCLIALVQRPPVDEFSAHITRAYPAATNIESQVYAVQVSPDAGPI